MTNAVGLFRTFLNVLLFLSNLLIKSLFFSDIEKIQAGIGDKLAIFIMQFATFLSGFVIAFIRNWKLALVVGIMLPLLSFLAAITAKV